MGMFYEVTGGGCVVLPERTKPEGVLLSGFRSSGRGPSGQLLSGFGYFGAHRKENVREWLTQPES